MLVNIQTIKDIRDYLSRELEEIYHEPEKTAVINLIMMTLLGVSKLHQIYNSDRPVTDSQVQSLKSICQDLQNGQPVQYVLGETVFYDCLIKVTPATLIPRPETEELVHLIINENKNFKGNIIDFGTGSGCIAIAIAANLKEANVTGIDISEEALSVAEENAGRNSVNITLIKGDILNFRTDLVKNQSIIVSNPPYVRNSEKELMHRNVLDFEPHKALFVEDSDPLVFYRAILEISSTLLIPGGKIYFEINEAFGSQMKELMNSFGYNDATVVKDINGKDRIIKGTKNG